MSSPFTVIKRADLQWQDGLPFSNLFQDVYFSRENGFREKQYVFLEGNHLAERWQAMCRDSYEFFTIAEIGFGTGLNFLLTWRLWLEKAPDKAKLYFYSCEKFPLNKNDLTKCLAIWPELDEQSRQLVAAYPQLTPGFHQLSFADGRINLILMLGEASSCLSELIISGDHQLDALLRCQAIDAWYLDGFTPSKNEELWSDTLFGLIALLSGKGTTLTTYSVAAAVKTRLTSVGFIIHKLPGYGQKRHMLSAKFDKACHNNPKPLTPWHLSLPRKSKEKKAIVLGAGLAGCFCAHALAKRGWTVLLLDEHQQPGQGASGNEQAVLYPKLSAFRSPLTELMLSAFLYAHRYYSRLIPMAVEGELKGMMQLAYNQKEAASQFNMQDWLSAYPEIGQIVDSEQASACAGIALKDGGIFIPLSGWLNSEQLCAHLTNHQGICWMPETRSDDFDYQDNSWHVGELQADVLILANGYLANEFAQTAHLPLKPIRGQMSVFASTKMSQSLKIPLCGEGHVLPARKNSHTVGATYHLGISNKIISETDDQINFDKLQNLLPQMQFSEPFLRQSWAGIRAATPDYLPLVGQVPVAADFLDVFAGLVSNSRRFIRRAAPAYPGLYICAGFGSRGLTTVPLCAEWLASYINQEPSFISRTMAQSISPSRFLFRTIIRPGK